MIVVVRLEGFGDMLKILLNLGVTGFYAGSAKTIDADGGEDADDRDDDKEFNQCETATLSSMDLVVFEFEKAR